MATLHEICEEIKTPDGGKRLYYVKKIRQLLSADTPPIDEIVQTGVIPCLIGFLKLRDIPLLFETSWVLTNLVSETNPHSTNMVVATGAVPNLMSLLHIDNEEVRNQAMWALSNIAANTGTHRDLILNAGALPAIVTMVRSAIQKPSRLSLLQLGSWTLGNLCKGEPPPPFELISPIFSCFSDILGVSDDAETIENIGWTLDELTSTHECRKALIKTSCLPRLLDKLALDPVIHVAVFRICGNLAGGSTAQTTAVLNSSFLQISAEILQRPPPNKLLKEICFVISNLAVTSVNEILNQDFLEHLVPYMDKTSLTISIKRELMHAVYNTIEKSNKAQLGNMSSTYSIIPRLCNILISGEDDRIVVSLVLMAIENILSYEPDYSDVMELNGGFDRIESLREGTHSAKANRIRSRHFQTTIVRRELRKILKDYCGQVLPIVLVDFIVSFAYPYCKRV